MHICSTASAVIETQQRGSGVTFKLAARGRNVTVRAMQGSSGAAKKNGKCSGS